MAVIIIGLSYVNCFAAAQTPELHTFNMVEDKNSPDNIFDVSFVDEDGKSPDSYIRLKSFNNQLLQGSSEYPTQYLPEDWDYDLLPTESQGSSGICWAYSADYALGYHEMIKNGKTANEVNFSEYPLAYFGSKSSKFTNDPMYNDGIASTNPYALGSQYIWMTGVLTRGTGPYLESELPTPNNPTGSETTTFNESLRYDHSHGLVTGMKIVSDCGGTKTDAEKQADISAIKEAVMNNGAVSAAITVNNIFYNSSTGAYYEPRTGSSGHQVTIVGWDDNYGIENFNYKQVTYGDGTKYITRPENNGAWLVQNSWGTNSGDNGFMWLSYENAYINHVMSFSMEPGDKYDKIYQYDGFGYGRFAGYSDATKTYDVIGGNVFTAEKKQYISDVGFYSENKNLTGTVKIYRLSSGYSYPTSGTCVTSATTDFQLNSKGYFKIPLKTSVLMDKGQVFSVVISLHAPSGEMPLFCLEQTFDQSEDITVVYTSKAKQSYYGYINGTKTVWDTQCGTNGTGTSGNVCIKAYAQDYKPVVTWKMGNRTVKQTYKQGDIITVPEIYEPEKHKFNRWIENIPSVISDADLTFNADYLYCPDYTWIMDDEAIVQSYVEGDKVVPPCVEDEETGYFTNWNQAYPLYAGDTDMTFSAVYKPYIYLDWIINNDTVSQKYKEGDSIVVPEASDFNNHVFVGWDKEIPERAKSSTTFTALYKAKVTYTWETNSGTITQQYLEGDPVFIPYSSPPKGYILQSWSRVIPSVAGNKDLTFSAIYAPAVKYKAYINFPKAVTNYKNGSFESLPAEEPILPGFKFIGYEDESGVRYTDNSTFTSDTILYAKFKREIPKNMTIITLIKNIVSWLLYPIVYKEYIV